MHAFIHRTGSESSSGRTMNRFPYNLSIYSTRIIEACYKNMIDSFNLELGYNTHHINITSTVCLGQMKLDASKNTATFFLFSQWKPVRPARAIWR